MSLFLIESKVWLPMHTVSDATWRGTVRGASVLLGALLVVAWFPALLWGLLSLRSRGRLGRSDDLIVTGAYRYVRHPLYAGLSLTLTGLGLVARRGTLVLAGLGWLLLTQAWSVGEEKELEERFGSEYSDYRRATPRVVPNVGLLAKDLASRRRTRSR